MAALSAASLLVACGAETAGGGTGADQPDPEPSATPAPSPTGPPWPDYPVDDYSYQLRVACFCPYAGIPVTVIVQDGQVTEVAHARSLRGHSAGDRVSDSWLRVTIDDLIDEANNSSYAEVDVIWKAEQGYPSSIKIDRAKNTIDDEVAYEIQRVRPST